MTIRQSLEQLPSEMVIELRVIDTGSVLSATVKEWLDQDLNYFEDYFEFADTPPLPEHLRPYEKGDLGGVIAPPNQRILGGTIGEWLQMVEPHTEASLASLGLGVLCGLGAYMGRQINLCQGNIRVTPNLFGVQVGPTGDARKGTADSLIYQLLTTIDPTFGNNISSGFGSGEMLVFKVSDPQYNKKDEQISGTKDQRLLIQESELSKHLRIADRQGNTLSEILRLAFDCERPLATSSRTRGEYRSTNHCISLFGGITPEELVEVFPALAATSGTGNRYLWAWSNPDKLLPSGGEPINMDDIANRIRQNITTIRRDPVLRFTEEAKAWWEELPEGLYAKLRHLPVSSSLKPLITRAYVQVMRVALIYAASDGRPSVNPADLEAGLGWFTHSIHTVETILGGVVRDDTAAKILARLREARGRETPKTDLWNLFSRNITAAALDAGLEELSEAGLAHTWITTSSGGRPPTMVMATTPRGIEGRVLENGYFLRTPRAQEKKGSETLFVADSENHRKDQQIEGEIENEESGFREDYKHTREGGTKELSLEDLPWDTELDVTDSEEW